MKNTMEYRGYIGSVEFSEEDEVFFGKVQGIQSLISYEGTTAKALIKDFHKSVDSYYKLCEETNTKPEIGYKGSLNIRIKKDLHKRAAVYAMAQSQSLNSFIEEAIQEKLFSVHA